MNKILIINQNSGYLMIDLANSLAEKNFDVSLLTGRLIVRNTKLHNSIKLRKILSYNRNTTFSRIISWMIAFIQITWSVKIHYRQHFIIIVSNPPLNAFLPIFVKNRFSYLVFDLYPQILVKKGILRNESFVNRFWMKTNLKVFRQADEIFAITESMAEAIQPYCNNKNIQVVPLWGHNNFFNVPDKNCNPFIAEHKLQGKFIVLYSGNLGANQNSELFLELAMKSKNPDIIFLIIGEGSHKKFLEQKVENLKIDNCILLPFLPAEILPYSFSAADLAIVSIGPDISELSIPSKTFSYIAAGLPLMCISPKNSELERHVRKFNNGESFTIDQIKEMTEFIEDLSGNENKLTAFRRNSLEASKHFSIKNAEIIPDILVNSIFAQ
ncbi:MAG TPA: glycosyltransferase family 4 protein [Bacteroidales bacterium]|nr:glycosyltransferase family 4 protein [Bacteroidales bacterium]